MTTPTAPTPSAKRSRRVRDQLVELGWAAALPRRGFVFVALDHEHDVVLDAIHTAFDGIRLIGCTTDGELTSHDCPGAAARSR